MRNSFKLILLAVASAGVSAGVGQPVRSPFSLTISTPTTTVKSGSEVRINITMSNTSNQKILLFRAKGDDSGEFNNDLQILDDKANSAPVTEYRRRLKGEPGRPGPHGEPAPPLLSSDIGCSLEPGKSMEEVIVANKLYDLSQPGKYSIQVSRFDLAYSKTWVKSNTITLTVVP